MMKNGLWLKRLLIHSLTKKNKNEHMALPALTGEFFMAKLQKLLRDIETVGQNEELFPLSMVQIK